MEMTYDAFTFFNELDLLELRLSILDDYVDKFILVESRQTFTGIEKPLYYAENKERFAKWNDKIIHIVAPNIEIKQQAFERHWLCYEIIEEYLLKNADKEDVVFCSDLDEIWNPDKLLEADDQPHSLAQLNYTYWLNYRMNEDWTGSLMTKVKNIFIGFNKINRTVKPNRLMNGGWHFTNMGGVEQIKKKVEAYDHGPEIPQEWFRDTIAERVELGMEFLGREYNYKGEPYRIWEDESEWPEYLKNNKDKYKHLCK